MIDKPLRWSLKMSGGIMLGEWIQLPGPPLAADFYFPLALWEEGGMILGGLPIKVNKWVKLYCNGRLQWTMKLGHGVKYAKGAR